MNNKKLNLLDLKVKSFTTTSIELTNAKTIKGGDYKTNGQLGCRTFTPDLGCALSGAFTCPTENADLGCALTLRG